MHSEAQTIFCKTVCPLDCPDSCGMIAKVEDGIITSLAGDPEHPYTKGVICRKMRTYHQRVYSADRILYPQLRVGPKGAGEFKRISWQEALSLFAEQLKTTRDTYGGEAILPYQYAGNMGAVNRDAGYAVYHKLGASRLKETICSAAASAGWALHLGNVPGSPPEVAEDADLIVAWGINIKVTNIHLWQYISRAKKKGAKLLVIDPYRNETCQSADEFLQILPGGDGALALGALKALLEMDQLDRNMIDEQTTGFATLESYLRKTSWSEFSRLSGIDRQGIEKFAGMLKTHPKTFLRIGYGLSRNSRGGMSVRSIASLAAALGLFSGGEGRGVLMSTKGFGGNSDLLRFPELMPLPTREISMAHLGHALTALKPPVHMFVVYNCNPLSVAPDSSMVRMGLAREDLFTVVHEQVMTPTARYADLLLPATTFLENMDLYTGYGHFQMAVVDKVIEPVGETKSNFDLFQELAAMLGYSEKPFQQSVSERIASYIKTMDGLPVDFSFAAGATTDWVTSTRKRVTESVMQRWQVPFAFQAETAAQTSTIPCLLEADEFSDRDLCSRLPLQLITPPHKDLLNSTFGERYAGVVGTVLIHPADAAAHGIADGTRVRVSNHRGWALRIAQVTEDTQKGLLVAEGLFWQTEEAGTAINDLTSQKLTDLAEGPTFHEARVDIRPE